MQLILFACAESASVDQATNRLSVFHFLEEIFSPVFPAAYPQMTIVAIASRESSEPSLFNLHLRVTLIGQEIPVLQGPFQIDFQERRRSRTLGQISGMPLPGPGILRFALFDQERELSGWDVALTQVGQPQIITQPGTGPATTVAVA